MKAIIILFSVFCGVALGQGTSFCIPPEYSAQIYTTVTSITSQGSTNFLEYIADYYYSVSNQAILLNVDDIDTNTQYSVLNLYSKGTQYVFTNTTCSQQTLPSTEFNNCGQSVDTEGPFQVGGKLPANLLTSINQNVTSEVLVTIGDNNPISSRSVGSYNSNDTLLYDLKVGVLPAGTFTPPSDCSSSLHSRTIVNAPFKPVIL